MRRWAADAWCRLHVWWHGSDPVRQRIGHRLTQPGHKRQAVAYWHRCAQAWLVTRFASELQEEGWQPAQRCGPRQVA